MHLLKRIKKLLRTWRHSDATARANGELNVMRLEKRRLLNADFTLLAGMDLGIDNVEADLNLQEATDAFEFHLDNGIWNGMDVAGQITGAGTSTLRVNKSTLNGLDDGVNIQASTAPLLSFSLDSNQEPLDLSNMEGTLTVDGFETVSQSAAAVSTGDFSVSGAGRIALAEFSGGELDFSAEEIDFLGGANSVSGSSLLITTTHPVYHVGGSGDVSGQLDFTDTDIAALANGFSSITFGAETGASTLAIRVDASGANFGDNLVFDVRNPGGVIGDIEIEGDLTTLAHNDAASITLLGNNGLDDPNSTTQLSGNLVTQGGDILIQDAILIEGHRTIDSTNAGTASGGDVQIDFEITGTASGNDDALTITTVHGDSGDGINDGDITLGGPIGNNPILAPAGAGELEELRADGDSVSLASADVGELAVRGVNISLTGSGYAADDSIEFDGAVVSNSSGSVSLVAGTSLLVDGTFDAPATSTILLQAPDVAVAQEIGANSAPANLQIRTNELDLADVEVANNFLVQPLGSSVETKLRGMRYSAGGDMSFGGNVATTSPTGVLLQAGGDLIFQDSLNLDGSGAVTLEGTLVSVNGTVDDANSNSPLTINAREAQFLSDIGSSQAVASLTADVAAIRLHSTTSSGVIQIAASPVLTIAPEILLTGARYESGADIVLDGAVDLSAGDTTLQSNNGGNITLTDNMATNSGDVFLQSAANVTLQDVDAGTGDVRVQVDHDDNGQHSLVAGVVSANNIEFSGSAECDDSLTLNDALNAGGLVRIESMTRINIESQIDAAGDVLLSACDDIQVGSAAFVRSTNGNLLFTADEDNDNVGGITIEDGGRIIAETGTITLQASEDILLTGLTTGNATSAAVTITTNGSVLDHGDTNLDIDAQDPNAVVTIVAGGNIGDAGADSIFKSAAVNALETRVDRFDLTAGGSLAIEDSGVGPAFNRIDVGGTAAGTARISAIGNILASDATGIDQFDSVEFRTPETVFLPNGLTAAHLRTDAGAIQSTGVVSASQLLVNSASDVTMSIDTDEADVSADGTITLDSTGSRPLHLVDLDCDDIAVQTTITDGEIQIRAADELVVDDDVYAANVDGGGSGSIEIDAAAVQINDLVRTSDGTQTISATTDISLSETALLTSTTGDIRLAADSAAAGNGGQVTMANLSQIVSQTGGIALTADGDVTVSSLRSSVMSDVAIEVESRSGAIVDGGDAHRDIHANETDAVTILRAAAGIGSADSIETTIHTVDAINGTSGGIDIHEQDNLNVLRLEHNNGSSAHLHVHGSVVIDEAGHGVLLNNATGAGSGRIMVHALEGTLTVNQTVQNNDPNPMSMIMLRANGEDSDILLNALVESAAGNVMMRADDSVFFLDNGEIRADGAGQVMVVSNLSGVAGDDGHVIDRALIDAGSGRIILNAAGSEGGDISLNRIRTDNNSADAVSISTGDRVIDADDSETDIIVNADGAVVTISAVNGVGDDNPLETRVHQIDVFNSDQGTIRLIETDDLRTHELVQNGTDAIDIATGGHFTVNEGGRVAIDDSADANSAGNIQIVTTDGSIVLEESAQLTNANEKSGAEIVLTANGTNSGIELHSDNVVSGSTNILLTADDRIFLGDTSTVSTSDGDIVLVANNDAIAGDSNDEISMAPTARLETQTGRIDLTTAGEAGGDISIGELDTQRNAPDAVQIISQQAIHNSGAGLNIDASAPDARIVLVAQTGIGTGRAIETATPLINAQNGVRLDDAATGNIEINNRGDLELEQVSNFAAGLFTGDADSGVISIDATGDLFIPDNQSDMATVHAENAIELSAEDITVDDDISAVDDTPGTDGIDERIEILARGNFDLLANRTITTDDDPGARFVTPDQQTDDSIRIVADADGNSPVDPLTEIPTEGRVFVDATAQITTDGGIANLFSLRPDSQDPDAAFFDVNSIATSDLQVVETGPNVYQGFLTVRIGNPGEENLVLDIDWGDGQFVAGIANEVDPNAAGEFSAELDSDKTRFLIPEGGREYAIPHRYSEADVNINYASEPGRAEGSDPIQVRFAVSQHTPSIYVAGRVIIDPVEQTETVVPAGDDIAPLSLISSTNVVDEPQLFLPSLDSGVAEFTIPTRSVPRALLVKRVIQIPEPKKISSLPDTVLTEETLAAEEVSSSASGGGTGSEDFFQLRRRDPDGTFEIIIRRIDDGTARSLFENDAFEEFVAEENLDDGSGFEIWLITSDPGGDALLERPVFEFDVTGGKPGPAVEDLPEEFPELRLVPVDEDGVPLDLETGELEGEDDESPDQFDEDIPSDNEAEE